MVPIVIRNAGQVMWRGAQTIKPGTVEVAVLDPVDTSAWKPPTIDQHVAFVRDLFVKTLADWPADGRGERRARSPARARASQAAEHVAKTTPRAAKRPSQARGQVRG
jgi:hypothetical protein